MALLKEIVLASGFQVITLIQGVLSIPYRPHSKLNHARDEALTDWSKGLHESSWNLKLAGQRMGNRIADLGDKSPYKSTRMTG